MIQPQYIVAAAAANYFAKVENWLAATVAAAAANYFAKVVNWFNLNYIVAAAAANYFAKVENWFNLNYIQLAKLRISQALHCKFSIVRWYNSNIKCFIVYLKCAVGCNQTVKYVQFQ